MIKAKSFKGEWDTYPDNIYIYILIIKEKTDKHPGRKIQVISKGISINLAL